MTTRLDKKRVELELVQVSAARHGLEFIIEEIKEEIERVSNSLKLKMEQLNADIKQHGLHIDIQLKKENEIKQKLQNM